MADIETRIRRTLSLVREALTALEEVDPAVLREATELAEAQTARYEAAKRKLEEMFLPELHQARWVERLVQLHEEQGLAATPDAREAIEARIREHHRHRHDLDRTRRELEASHEASEANRLAIPAETPSECLRKIEHILARALERLEGPRR